jgi:hypothetical protein
MTDGLVGPHEGAAMRARSITLLLTYLLIAVPLTVQSRAHRLQPRGLIQPRPKGGTYPR